MLERLMAASLRNRLLVGLGLVLVVAIGAWSTGHTETGFTGWTGRGSRPGTNPRSPNGNAPIIPDACAWKRRSGWAGFWKKSACEEHETDSAPADWNLNHHPMSMTPSGALWTKRFNTK